MTYDNQMSNASEWLVGAAKKNPEGLLLLAAGAALLLRRGMSSPRPANRRPSQYPDAGSQRSGARAGSGSSQPDGGISDTISKAADSAREYASELRDNVGDKVGEYAAAVKDYATDAGQTIADQSERLARRARSTAQGTIERVLEQQPLAVAVLGFAAGALVAASAPPTDIERRTLGPAGERLSDAAASAGKRINEAASAVGERLKEAADEKGLNAEGLKNMARDVTGTFGDVLSGETGSDSGKSSSGAGTRNAPTSSSAPSAGKANSPSASSNPQSRQPAQGTGGQHTTKPAKPPF